MTVDPWQYTPAQDLDRSLVERLRHFPREPDMLVYSARIACALLMRQWLRVYHRFRIRGREHLPENGSYVLVANHASHLDAACLISALRLSMIHRAFPAAAQDYFFVNVPRTAIAAVVINALPFDRDVHVRHSLALCRSILESPGNVLILFPEGSRSATGQIGAFKPGIGLLVAGTDFPVVPCYLAGAGAAWPKGTRAPRPRRVELRIGPARTYSQVRRSSSTCQAVADDLQAAVVKLSLPTPTDPAADRVATETTP